MVLPLVKPARGYLRLSYIGEVGIAGTDVLQSWSLASFPDYVRADPMFKGSLVLFVKGAITGVSAVSFLPAVGTPDTLVLTLSAANITDEIDLDVWCLFSAVGGLLDGPRFYFMGGSGGGSEVRQWTGATKTQGQTLLPAGNAGQIAFQVPIPAGVSRSFAITALLVGRTQNNPATCQELFFSAHRDDLGVIQFSSSDINLTLRGGSGSNQPSVDGGANDADHVWPTFNVGEGSELCLDWEYSVSPPLLDTFTPVPPPP